MSKRVLERCVTIFPDDVWQLICAYFINDTDIKTCLNMLSVSPRASIWFDKSLQMMLNLLTFIDHGQIFDAMANSPDGMGFIRDITQSQKLLDRGILSEILYFIHVSMIQQQYSGAMHCHRYPFAFGDVKIRQVFYYDAKTRRMQPLEKNPDIKVINLREYSVCDQWCDDDEDVSKLSFYCHYTQNGQPTKLEKSAMYYDIYRREIKHWEPTPDDSLDNVVFRHNTTYHHIGLPTPQPFHLNLYMYRGVGTIEKKRSTLLLYRNYPLVKKRSLAVLKDASIINIG
jgi:hypothetical protein